MKDLFIPQELAIIAKQKGFNEPCIAEYYGDLLTFYINTETYQNGKTDRTKLGTYDNSFLNHYEKDITCSAPLYQQILNWLRIYHSIKIVLDAESDCECYYLYNNRQVASKHGYIDKAIEKALTLIK